MKEKKKLNSLFIYTALIFLVALVMILLSFFGQKNFNQTEETQKQNLSLSEKATAVSEENYRLNTKITENEHTISKLTNDNVSYANLISAYERIYEGNVQAASECMAQVNLDSLSSDALILYNQINQIINKGE